MLMLCDKNGAGTGNFGKDFNSASVYYMYCIYIYSI